MRVSILFLLMSLGFSKMFPAKVLAQSYWQVYETTAYITEIFPEAKNNAMATFIVAFKKNDNCKVEIGLMCTNGRDPGNPNKRSRTKENMSLEVGMYRFSGKTTFTKYDNGFEVTMLGNNEIINMLKSSSSAILRATNSSQGIRFPLERAETSINSAMQNCYSPD